MGAQVYEDTSGLTLGDPVTRTGKPLSVELGPGLLSNIYDGIQRPLKAIAKSSGDVFIPRGVSIAALDRSKTWEWSPKRKVKAPLSCDLALFSGVVVLVVPPSRRLLVRVSSTPVCAEAEACFDLTGTAASWQLTHQIDHPFLWARLGEPILLGCWRVKCISMQCPGALEQTIRISLCPFCGPREFW